MQIDHHSSQPYYLQIVTGIQRDCAQGILRVGDQLPSVREMAKRHLLNPNTVSKAYKQLEAQHVIQTVAGKGTYVATTTQAETRQRIYDRLQELVTQAQAAGITVAELANWLAQMRGTSK
ncbi:GntR family transcriptional regulator [Lactiplantibacillus modestisalitolerans]|uniref:GntR family transcriptional regulator n=1 Tax=Lactiplantibacillus modestisalitolerans TaxID=1457219 RepID=A0ABV5WV83_9LACO|nr:GntR family transcriptional regulator [Lactiplantibacillus modestisalitolerans]